jgi:hypothetical protein
VILKSLAKKRASRFESVRALNQAYQAALAGKALPEFDGVPVGPTVRLPPREVPKPEKAAPPKSRRPIWLYALLLPILGVAAFMGFRLLQGLGTTTPAPGTEPSPLPIEAPTTELPTSTPQPSATPAPEPITSQACPGLILFPPQIEGNQVSWLLDNASGSTVRFLGLETLGWPVTGNGPLLSITWGGQLLGEGSYQPDSNIELEPQEDPLLPAGSSTLFALGFSFEASRSGYDLGLILDAGCTLAGSW